MAIKERSEFIGVQIGDRRFSEHANSISEKGRPYYNPVYALPGCGLKSKFDERTATLPDLLKTYKGKLIFFGESVK